MTHSASSGAMSAPSDRTTGELVSALSEQTTRLIRDELRLAQLEMTEKGKKAGLGVGLFGGAGVIALYGLGCLVAAAVLGLAVAMSPWLAAIIVAVVLFAVAGVAAMVGKREVAQATPPVPTEAVDGLKQDVQTLKPGSTT
jgi:uncharacterized membrane protein YqjE